MTKLPDDVAIRVHNVHKDFHLPHHNDDSIKHKVITAFRKKDKDIDTLHALKGVSFDIKKGEFFGVLGRNGSGKSTLLKIISNIYQPTTGTTSHRGTLVAFIELGVGFNPQLTGRDNVYLNAAMLGFSRKEIDAMYDEIVTFAELEEFMDLDLKNYSSGMKVRLAFSVAIRANADILILDEVLAVGDPGFRQKCYNYFQNLKEEHKTIVFVSHSMSLVRQYCDRAVLIEDGKVAFEGDADETAEAYQSLFTIDSEGQGIHEGSGAIKLQNLKLKVTRAKVTIGIDVESSIEAKDVMLGVNVTQGKTIVTTTPRELKEKNIFSLAKGEHKHMEFIFDNLFGGNNYQINAKLHSADNTELYDFWQNAAQFTNEGQLKVAALLPLEITASDK